MEDWEYVAGYKENRLYVNPKAQTGAYAAIAQDSEIVIDEFDVGSRFRIAVTAFFVDEKQDFSTYKIHKLQFRVRSGWFLVESLTLNGFQLEQIRRINSTIGSLKLTGSQKNRIDLGKVDLEGLVDLLATDRFADISNALSNSESLTADIFALQQKRSALEEFRQMLTQDTTETAWQAYFEENTWIFGFGLKYVFLDRVGRKFEAITSGTDFHNAGKRADGLARTRAKVSQFVLIEIKSHRSKILSENEYRSGVWGVTSGLSNAVSQAQKTLHDFANGLRRVWLRNENGDDQNESVYSVLPKSYLIVGSLGQISQNTDKVACFELYRRNISEPEILTFDELYYRAVNLLEGLADE